MVKNILAAVAVFAIFIVAVFIWQLATGLQNGEKEVTVLPRVKIGDNVFLVEIADDPAERARGLSGRESLAEDHGMLFLFEAPEIQNFWMKGMKFPLDIIWISNGKVVGMVLDARPETKEPLTIYSSPRSIDEVLEVNAGIVDKFAISIGDRVILQ